MTLRNWVLDVWKTAWHGKWIVRRGEAIYIPRKGPGFGLAQIKSEGSELQYDPYVRYDYYAICERTSDLVLCSDKREAEALCAYRNDMRGVGVD